MKKLLAIILAGLMLLSCMAVAAFADEDAPIEAVASDGKVTLSWNDVGRDYYTVYWKRSSSDEWKIAGTTAKHKVNITGLNNGISYDFKVGIEDGFDGFSETVTATPVEDPTAIIEYFQPGEDSGGSCDVYAIKDSEVVENLLEARKSIFEETATIDYDIVYPYYKIIVPDGDKEVIFFVSDDFTNYYYLLVKDLIGDTSPELTVEMPYMAEDFDEVYVTEAEYAEYCAVEEWGITENWLSINSLLVMYYALDDIIEPTDEELQKVVTRGLVFYVDDVKYSFTVDENNTVICDFADGYYKFTDDRINYFSILKNY